jgi:hypothetical protein
MIDFRKLIKDLELKIMIDKLPPHLQPTADAGLIGINEFIDWAESFDSIAERDCWLAGTGYLQSNACGLPAEWSIVSTSTTQKELINIELLIDRDITDDCGRPYKFSGWEFPAKDHAGGFWRSVQCFCNETGWFYCGSIESEDFNSVPKDALISPSYALVALLPLLYEVQIGVLELQQIEVA